MNFRLPSLFAVVLGAFSAGVVGGGGLQAVAQSAPFVIDASRPFQEPGPSSYKVSDAQAPDGRVLGLNSRYLTLDGKPWLPVMGEFHFSRYPEARWEEEILKMKAAGVNIIATYVIWIHHEEIEGQFDWSGQRDLRAFAQLCQKHHMYLVVRIGPWAHGEVRNGGFPDWVVKQGNTRENDPAYLRSVRSFYRQIGKQTQGLLWKDGGPIIGVQLENEYARRGPGQGEEHILELKKIARECGLDVPFYFVTGWDHAVVPESAVLPLQGGYPDAPWDASLAPWPPAELYAFRFKSRVAADLPTDGTQQQPVPFLTAEVGGGNEDTYHRRPVIGPDDVAATAPVMLGSGVNLYGIYMFHGGENPEGKLTTLQESQSTGYPNDLPEVSYDFQAPLGEFGQERPSLRKLKLFQYFLNDFGAELAPMETFAPERQPSAPGDLSVLRAAVRARGDGGFLFVNNHVRGAKMPARVGTQFEIRLPQGIVRMPRKPVDIPADAYFIWPFNWKVGGVTLRYATAQPLTVIDGPGERTLYFVETKGVSPEFAVDAAGAEVAEVKGTVVKEAGTIYVGDIKPGVGAAFELKSKGEQRVRVVVLSQEDAENAWKVRIGGQSRLLITQQDFFEDSDSHPERVWLRRRGAGQFAFTVAPPLGSTPKGSLALEKTAASAEADTYIANAPATRDDVSFEPTKQAETAPPVRMGPVTSSRPKGVAQAPEDKAFEGAAAWKIRVPAQTTEAIEEVFLAVRYKGDEARLYSKGKLLTDDFFNGQTWSVGLSRFLDLKQSNELELRILPLRSDAPIYLEPAYRPVMVRGGQTVELDALKLVPEYNLTMTFSDSKLDGQRDSAVQ